jgi:hypothetical protein
LKRRTTCLSADNPPEINSDKLFSVCKDLLTRYRLKSIQTLTSQTVDFSTVCLGLNIFINK